MPERLMRIIKKPEQDEPLDVVNADRVDISSDDRGLDSLVLND